MEAFPIELRRGDGVRIRDNFGDPRSGHAHRGIDIAAPRGRVIRAPIGGRVVRAHELDDSDCGFGVILDGDDGRRWTLCHFEAAPLVFNHERIETGHALGTLGASGNATWTDRRGNVHRAYHLHIGAARLTPSDRRLGTAEDIYAELVEARANDQARILPEAAPTRVPRASARTRTRSGADSGLGLALAVGAGLWWWSTRKDRRP